MNYSRQRTLILNILRNTKSHPTADWVHKEAKKTLPSIGIATVYRNLNALSQMGECRKIVVEGDQDRFDADMSVHYHMECSRCGSLQDLKLKDNMTAEELNVVIKKAFGIENDKTELSTVLFKGVCEHCSLKADKEN